MLFLATVIVAVLLLTVSLVYLKGRNGVKKIVTRPDGTKEVTDVYCTPFFFLPHKMFADKLATFAEAIAYPALVPADESLSNLIYNLWIGIYQVTLVCHPKVAEHIFKNIDKYDKTRTFNNDFFIKNVAMVGGQEWRTQRHILNPAFKYAKLKSLAPSFLKVIDELLGMWDALPQGKVEDSYEWMQKMTLDVLGLGAFSYPFRALHNSNDEHLKRYNRLVAELISPRRILFPLADWLPLGSVAEDIDKFQKFLESIIEHKRQTKTETSQGADLLDLLLEGSEEQQLSDIEVKSNLFIFFLAGHDTTAGVLSTLCAMFAKHPDIQAKAREEVERVCGQEAPKFEDLKALDYISAALKECLRLYPPANMLRRTLVEDDSIVLSNDLEYHLPKGTKLIIDIWGLHHSPLLWNNPHEFQPERFLKPAETEGMLYSMFGFGGGPRMCIGNNFSLIEQKIFTCRLLQKYEVFPNDKTHIRLPRFGIMHPLELSFNLRARK